MYCILLQKIQLLFGFHKLCFEELRGARGLPFARFQVLFDVEIREAIRHPHHQRRVGPLKTDAERPWAFANVNIRPFYAEGSKTLAFETAEQLGWQTPDHVVVPVGSGSLLTKIRRGFDELHQVGLLDTAPQVRVSGAQATGCSPVAVAFAEESDTIRPVKPDTIAKSLAIGNPADGYYALDTVRETGGGLASVTDDEVVDGIRLLARTEGIFGETAVGVTIASLRKLAEAGVVRKDERVVVYVTGHGLKTLDALDALEPGAAPATVIAPTIDAFWDAYPGSRES